MSVEQALSTSRVHHQWMPEVTFIEDSQSVEVKKSLESRGHKIYSRGYLGATQAIKADGKEGFESASEPRIVRRNNKQ